MAKGSRIKRSETSLLLSLPAETKTYIFQRLPDLWSAISLRLACRDLNDVYVANETQIKRALIRRLIAPIEDFYLFLTTLHIPPSAIKYPPASGWPNITTDNCRGFGKADYVTDVLRQLPYISKAEGVCNYDNCHNIEYKCNVLDYSACKSEDFGDERLKCGEIGHEPCDVMPRDVIIYDDSDLEIPDSSNDERYAGSALANKCSTTEAEDENEPKKFQGSLDEPDEDASGDPDQDFEESDEDSSENFDGDSEESEDDAIAEPEPLSEESIMKYRVVLAEGHESNGVNLLLDTMSGMIFEEVIGAYSGKTLYTKTFFKEKKREYMNCELLFIPGDDPILIENQPTSECLESEDEATATEPSFPGTPFLRTNMDSQWIRHLYRSHGWPSRAWKKDEGLAAIADYVAKRNSES